MTTSSEQSTQSVVEEKVVSSPTALLCREADCGQVGQK